jgi:hypothetical protein
LNDSSLYNFGFSVSTGALGEDGLKLVVLLGGGEKLADPDNLLEALLFADLKDDLLGVTKLVGWESVTPVYKERNVVFPGSDRRGRNLIDWPPRKPKGSRLIECMGRQTQQAGTFE